MPCSDRWLRASLLALSCSTACLQGCGDPVDHLVQAIRSPRDRYALDEAIDAVNRTKRGNEAAALLIRLLKDDHSSARGRAARALGRIHADANVVVTALIEAREDEVIRFYATESLGEVGPVDDRVIPALILSLKDQKPIVRGAAVSAFFKIGPAGAAAVPALIELLNDGQIGYQAAQTIGRMGSRAKPAAPALIGALKTAEGYERLHAAEALWRIDQNLDIAVPALIESLKDPFLPIRRDAANVLGEIGPPARAAIPALVATRDYRPKRGPKRQSRQPKEEELPVVEEMPEEEFYPQVRDAAVEALSKIKGGK